MLAISTAFGGNLVLALEGYHWSDGTPEPRVRPMYLQDLAPNYRCANYGTSRSRTTFVEIPVGWTQRVADPDVREAIGKLIGDCGQKAAVYAEGLAEALDNHRVTREGWLIPIEAWDRAMRSAPVGIWWDKSDEPEVLAKAASLGWVGP